MRRLSTTVTSLGLMLLVSPGISGQVTSLGNVRTVKRVEVKKLPKEVTYVFNRTIGAGRMIKSSEGADGQLRKTVQEVFVGSELVASAILNVERVEPKPIVFEMGRSGFETSRGAFTRSRVMTVTATAYTPWDGSGTGRTATGRMARYGVIAVDPRVIPLHSLVYVEGYGFAIAADTGGAIKGNKIDVCLPTGTQCRKWGRKKVVIHVFKERAGKRE